MALQWKLEIFSAWTRKLQENHIQDKKTISNTYTEPPECVDIITPSITKFSQLGTAGKTE